LILACNLAERMEDRKFGFGSLAVDFIRHDAA
jgi:hypothetical protein